MPEQGELPVRTPQEELLLFIQQVPYASKDEAWNQWVCDSLVANDIKTIEDVGSVKFSDITWNEGGSPGKRAFAEAVFKEWVKHFGLDDSELVAPFTPITGLPDGQASPAGPARTTSDVKELLQETFCEVLGVAKKTHNEVAVDVSGKLESMGLGKWIPDEAWPPSQAVNQLAGKLKALTNKGQDKPFVFVDLKKFLPAFCPDYKVVCTEDDSANTGLGKLTRLLDGDAKEETQAKDKKKDLKLSLPFWMLAWDSYAIAAAILGQLTYSAAVKHKLVVAEIATEAVAEGRRPILGVIYDEIARKEWEEKSAQLGKKFDVNGACEAATEKLLRRARIQHDRMFGAPTVKSSTNSQSWSSAS
eukprot:3763641-Karenia_brevis.AAC.1